MLLYTRSQSEIVGITIVMVLIMLGIIFVLRFVVLDENENIKSTYDQTQLAANFMDTALKTTTTCNTLSVTELIQDCAENYGTSYLYQCPEDSINSICIGGCNSCKFLNETLDIILSKSLNLMPQIQYDFLICEWDNANSECSDVLINYSKGGCLNSPTGYEAKQQPIPTNVGPRVTQMYICRPS